MYLDTHAGRGRHAPRQAGSPVMAIDTLLSHTYRDRILQKSEVMFFLIEHDPENLDLLRAEVVALGKLPARVQVHISCDDCFTQMERILSNLEEKAKRLLRRSCSLIHTVSKSRAILFADSWLLVASRATALLP